PSLDWWWIPTETKGNLARFWGECGFKYLTYDVGHIGNAKLDKYRIPSMDAVMRACEEFGMLRFHFIKYVDTAKPGLSQEVVAAQFETNATFHARFDVKSVIGTIVTDEPELSRKSEDCYRYLKALRPFYPTRPMVMNNTLMGIPNDYAHLETDILMLDDYLTQDEQRTIASMMESIDAMAKKGRELARPSFAFVEAANYPLHPCEPTYGQQIAQCYAVLASGANGVVLWGLTPPATPKNWLAIKQLAKEFAVLENMILTEEPPPAVECAADRAKIRFRPAVKDGTLTLLTCNIDEQSAGKVVFNLPPPFSAAGEAEVLFENRKVKIENGAIADEFAGHTRHVYSVKRKE
ncbi:MAG: hypothetical protein IKU71_10940, partial [Kiritimatiellae bacterium]|nr:hypothetical protein [Kiritimatiellia bacterium]